MADDDSKWLEGVLGAASGEAPPPDMTDARCPKCGAQEFAKISELYPESLYRIEDGEASDDKRVGGMTDAQIVREFAPPTRGSAVMATAFVAVPLGAAAFYIYKKYGDNLGQIAAVATIVIVFAVFLTRMRAYSDKYYHARTRWNRMYMCRNCGQRVAG
jgi:hypothetical protein